MGYLWKKDPKGQYKDGYKCEDVVAYWQNVFLPYVATLIPHMHCWTHNGTLEMINEGVEGPNEPGTQPQANGQWIIIWVHDESTFYANNQLLLQWVHESKTAKPYAKGKGPSQVVANFVSPDYSQRMGKLQIISYDRSWHLTLGVKLLMSCSKPAKDKMAWNKQIAWWTS